MAATRPRKIDWNDMARERRRIARIGDGMHVEFGLIFAVKSKELNEI